MRHRLATAVLAVPVFVVCGWARTAAALPSTLDVMPAFFSAYDADREKPMEQRVADFRAQVVKPHADAFVRVGPLDDAAIALYLHAVSPSIEAMRRYAAAMPQRVTDEGQRFAKRYPDYAPPQRIVFMPSLFHFNGQIRFHPDATLEVALGIDTIARNATNDAQLALEIDHELFHVYHAERQIALAKNLFASGVPVWFETWAEGLAAYGSAEMNPPLDRAAALGSESLSNATAQTRRALACLVREHFDEPDPSDALSLFSGGSSPPDLPDRGAYLVGYVAAQHLAESRSTTELAALHDDALRAAVLAEVAGQCATTSSTSRG